MHADVPRRVSAPRRAWPRCGASCCTCLPLFSACWLAPVGCLGFQTSLSGHVNAPGEPVCVAVVAQSLHVGRPGTPGVPLREVFQCSSKLIEVYLSLSNWVRIFAYHECISVTWSNGPWQPLEASMLALCTWICGCEVLRVPVMDLKSHC